MTKKNREACFLALFLLVASGTAVAQDASVLDLASCVEKALAASDELRAQASREAAQEARLDQARDQRLPSLTAGGSYTYSSEVDPGTITTALTSITLPAPLRNATALRLQMQAPLYMGGRISAGIRVAGALSKSEAAQTDSTRAFAAEAAEKAYWNLYLAQEGEAAAQENLAATKKHGKDAQSRQDQGAATRSEVLSWELRRVQAQLAVESARTRRAQASAALALLLGLPWDTPLSAAKPADPSDRTVIRIDPFGVDDCLFIAGDLRADLKAARAQVQAQKALMDQARGALLPSVFLTGSLSYADPNPKVFPQRDEFEPYWEVGILASFDLGGFPANQARVREAEANLEAARRRLAASRRGAEQEVVNTALTAQDAQRKMEVVAASVDLAQENLRVLEDRYAAGLALDAELADADAALLAARVESVSARVAWELAEAALRDAMGGSAEEAIGSDYHD